MSCQSVDGGGGWKTVCGYLWLPLPAPRRSQHQQKHVANNPWVSPTYNWDVTSRTSWPRMSTFEKVFETHSDELLLVGFTQCPKRIIHVNSHYNCVNSRCGASQGGPLSNTHNPTLGLSSPTFLRTASADDQTRLQHTPTPLSWWLNRQPLWRCGFGESTKLEGLAALCIYCLRLLSKDFNSFTKLM